tara:strand:- start:1000 stop:1440 length:441 start_codon:yes stop_codon:yes gene_type:complete
MSQDIDKIKQQRARDIRIMRDKAAVNIARWALPTIILLFAGLVGSIVWIEDMSAIAIISAATSSTSMALISILNTMTGHKDKEDPIVSIIKGYSDQNAALIELVIKEKSKSQSIRLGDKEVSLTEGSTNIHVSDDDVVWGKDKPKK